MPNTFGIKTAQDHLELLEQTVQSFRSDDLNEGLALQCSCIAWQHCDWLFHDHGDVLGYHNLRALQDAMKRACRELAYMQDICIETKHATITRYTPTIDRAEYHGGAFSREFSRDFDISRLQIVVGSNPPIWFSDAVEAVLHHWQGVYSGLTV
jgi:hypothetical protein